MSVRAEDLGFVSDMQRALLEERRRGPRWLLIIIAALLASATAWAAFSRVEEITQGPARVVPSSREQLVQSLEGGIVQALLVREGDVVAQGQPLVRIDPTKADAAFREGRSKAMALRAMSVRLAAESRGLELRFPAGMEIDPGLVDNERRNFAARRRALEEGLATQRRSQALLAREIEMTAPMVDRGLVAEVELLRMRRQHNDLEMQIAERRNRFRAEESAYYRVLVRTEDTLGRTGGPPLAIIPGMTATVEIRSGEKTVLDYLLKPVRRSREALRER